MASNLARFAGAARAAALAGVVALAALALVAPASAAEKKEEISPKVMAKYKPAADAFNKDDLATALTAGKEALAIAEKPYDKEQMLIFLRAVYGKQKDFVNYADVQEQLNAMDIFPAADRNSSYRSLAQIYGQNKTWDKAVQYAIKWSENGGGLEADTQIWQIYLSQNDCEKGLSWLEKAAGEHEATEQELIRLNACYFKLGMKDKRRAAMEQLVKRFMKPEPPSYADFLGGVRQHHVSRRVAGGLADALGDNQ